MKYVTYACNCTVNSAVATPNRFNKVVCLLSNGLPPSHTVYGFSNVIFPFTKFVGMFNFLNSGSILCDIGTSSSAAISPPIEYTIPAGTTNVLVATVPARAKSVLENSSKYSLIALGSRFVNNRPTFPTRYLERRWVEGWYSSSGELPRAFATTFVLPKKSLIDSEHTRTKSLGKLTCNHSTGCAHLSSRYSAYSPLKIRSSIGIDRDIHGHWRKAWASIPCPSCQLSSSGRLWHALISAFLLVVQGLVENFQHWRYYFLLSLRTDKLEGPLASAWQTVVDVSPRQQEIRRIY